jgi:hypothetical protein
LCVAPLAGGFTLCSERAGHRSVYRFTLCFGFCWTVHQLVTASVYSLSALFRYGSACWGHPTCCTYRECINHRVLYVCSDPNKRRCSAPIQLHSTGGCRYTSDGNRPINAHTAAQHATQRWSAQLAAGRRSEAAFARACFEAHASNPAFAPSWFESNVQYVVFIRSRA